MRALVPVWNQLAKDYSHMGFEFVVVYILEAHAEDEWPINSSRHHPNGKVVRVTQHKTMEERFAAAREFNEVYGISKYSRLLVDTMDNAFNEQFAAWPFRCECDGWHIGYTYLALSHSMNYQVNAHLLKNVILFLAGTLCLMASQ